MSTWAYLVWTVSAGFLLAYPITTQDPVFISLQAYQLVALTLIYLLSRRHQGHPCGVHCGTPESREPETVVTSAQPITNLVAPTPTPLERVVGTRIL